MMSGQRSGGIMLRQRAVSHAAWDGLGHIARDQLEAGACEQMSDVVAAARAAACQEVVEADDFVTRIDRSLTRAGADEPGAPGNQYLQECHAPEPAGGYMVRMV